MDKLHKETEEVLEIMHVNVDKVKDRGEKLEVLDERAQCLMEAGKTFQKAAKVVAHQEKNKNRKWKLIVGGTVFLVVLIVIIIIIIAFSMPSPGSSSMSSPGSSLQLSPSMSPERKQ
ncbi:synaptobrevin-like [Mobula hypostoma]|uniref:synaptobrevin-like n=1 Tax=Mobula hypostoma TaxID=723540 RepID=UPI002FC28CD2